MSCFDCSHNALLLLFQVDADTFELNFARATTDDNGNWAVIARNAHGEMSQFFKFSAQMLPRFKMKISDLEANETKQASESLLTWEKRRKVVY